MSVNLPHSTTKVVMNCCFTEEETEMQSSEGLTQSTPRPAPSVDVAGVQKATGLEASWTGRWLLGRGVAYLHGGCCRPAAPAGDQLPPGGLGLLASAC